MTPIEQRSNLQDVARWLHSISSHFLTISAQAWPLLASATIFYLVCDVEQVQELAYISQSSATNATYRFGQGILVLAVFCIGFETCTIQWAYTQKIRTATESDGNNFSYVYAAAGISIAFPALIWRLVGFRWPDLVVILLGVIYVFSSSRRNRNTIVLRTIFLITLLFFMLLGIRFAVVEPEVARAVGTIGIAAIGFFILGEAVTLIFGLIPSVIRGKTAYLWLAPSVLLFVALYEPVEEKISNSHLDFNVVVDSLPSASEFTEAWLLKRQEKLQNDAKEPIYLVIAEGGGIRSAYWTANALNAIETESKGSFSSSTIAYSGISGGSVGIATFLACRGTEDPPKCIENTLGGDFLSPIVARLLFAEPIRFALQGHYILPRDDTFISMLEEQSKIHEAQAIWSSGAWAKSSDSALFFGSTDLQTGKRITFSNIRSPYYESNEDLSDASMHEDSQITPPVRNIIEELKAAPKLSFAVSASARFPGVSAPIRVSSHLLADGGYRENTGTEEVIPILTELSSLANGSSTRTKVAWIETDVPMGMIHGSDSDLVRDGIVSDYEVERVHVEIARAIKLKREIEPLIQSRPIRIILLRNTFSKKSQKSVAPLTEAGTAISGILAARVAKTDDAIIALRAQVFRDNVTRGQYSPEVYADKRYNDIPVEWVENPELFEKSEYVVGSFLTTNFTNDYCQLDRQPLPSDLIVLDLARFVKNGMRVPLGWTLSSTTKAEIRKAAVKALGENRVSIKGRYPIPQHVLENEDCSDHFESERDETEADSAGPS